ncbi:MAG: hypothetical protein JNK45_22405 [Myxococcales bacterium]|nr:hypothetical protein [Myxococcales bacterium]
MKTARRVALLASSGLGLALAACQPHYDGLEIRYINGVGEFSADGITIKEGQALAVEVTPLSDNRYEDYEKFDLVELESFNPGILVVSPSTDVDRFVFIGVSTGKTAVDVTINGGDVDTIEATVEAQSAGGR